MEPITTPEYYDMDTDEDDVAVRAGDNIDYIYSWDYPFIKSDKITYNYYIGSYIFVRRAFLLDMAISSKSFFKFTFTDVNYYINEYSMNRSNRPHQIEIMKLYVTKNKVNIVILKTVWIKLVQRHWKRAYRERRRHLLSRGNPAQQRRFELTGKWGGNGGEGDEGRGGTLKGMLSCYTRRPISPRLS
jgi:hypothetical protein